jgi:hypothetical protein
MLNNPARNAMATETPVMMKGVELLMVSEIARTEPTDPVINAL